MIPNGEGWHYLPVKNLATLLKDITSNHHVDFYCRNCFYAFATDIKVNLIKNM